MGIFILAIKEHTSFGFIITAHLAERKNEHFIEIIENIIFDDTIDRPDEFTEDQKSIIKTIDSYSDQNLTKIFSRKKTIVDFLKSVSDDDINKRIRPFIETRMHSVLERLLQSDTKLYYKRDKFNTLHNEDIVKLYKNQANTIFNIERDVEATKYYLSIKQNDNKINLTGKHRIILTNEPCTLILENHLYRFKDIDGKKLIPFFDKTHINIPKSAEQKWFEAFAVKAIQKYEVNAKGFTIEEKVYEGKAKLTLEKDWKGEYAFVLYFRYGDITYNSNKKVEHRLEFDETNFNFVKSLRNEKWENQIINEIRAFGLDKQNDNNFKLTAEFEDIEQQRHETISWLRENIHKIQNSDIDFIQDLHQKEYFTEKISLDIKTKEQKDWFDIYGTVEFGHFKIPFIQLKDHILSDKKEYILPDGTVAIIPDEWFAKYSDLFLFSDENSERLHLKKTHFELLDSSEIEGIDKSFKANVKKLVDYNKFEIELPDDIKAELRPYQKEGFKWLYFLQKNNFGGCLADDMGLGKTVQTITLLQKTVSDRKMNVFEENDEDQQLDLFSKVQNVENKKQASLIIMPISLLHNWEREFKKFAPNLKVLTYKGHRRHSKIKKFDEYDIILSGYGLIRNDIELLRDYNFLYVILDESQFIKNSDSKTYKALLELESDYKLVLTGTPIENSLSDLWSQLNFVNNGMLGNKKFFTENFKQPVEKNHDEVQEHKLKKIISPFILRRTKKEVAKDLPPLTEQLILCSQPDEQRSVYESEKSKMRNKFMEMIDSGDRKSLSVEVLSALSRLRQISNHPLLVDENYGGESGKFNEIIRNVESLTAENHKVLIFSSFVKHLKLLAKYLDSQGYKYSLLTGQTKNRKEVISDFQTDDENQLFLISIKAGGTGLNLTEADYVFILDPWWNPAVERQAVNRAHRIGQDKKVMVYRYISEDTIEEKIVKLQKKKSKLAETFINSNNPVQELSNDVILELFK